MRLDRAKKLLVDTDLPVGRIPERCGSDAPNHFARLFKARTGMTMLQFRRQEGASDFRRPGLRIRARLPR